ncbi:MAG: hypothetical protein LBU24_02960 [Methanocalculaceae archaeon]|jgi:hypothetical protein|nr:hypothetical protein [Methanocalculaceae archaeon]
MAIQTRNSAGSSPRRKKNINWTQVGVVAFCILLAVMCIVSFSGVTTIFEKNGDTTVTGPVRAGDWAEMEYTMYIGDVPMVTSSFDVFRKSVSNVFSADKPLIFTRNLSIVAGQQADTVNGTRILIDILPSAYDQPMFWMLNSESNQVTAGVIGLRLGEPPREVLSTGDTFKMDCTKDRAIAMGLDYNNWTVGAIVILNFPEVNAANNTTTMAIRPALVINKTDEKMVLQYGYDTIKIKLLRVYRPET